MSSIEIKRERFRKYLIDCGVMSAITHALIKLYDEQIKPVDAVEFVRNHLYDVPQSSDDVDGIIHHQCEQNKSTSDDLEQNNNDINNNVDNNNTSLINKQEQSESIIDEQTRLLLEKEFENLQLNFDCTSLLKKYLTKTIFEQLQNKTTKYRSTLYDCIRTDLDGDLSTEPQNIGICAPDSDAYTIYKDLFDPIIEEYHKIDKNFIQPQTDWGNLNNDCFNDIEINTESIVHFIGIICERSIDGSPFTIKMNDSERLNIYEKVKRSMDGWGIDGKFYDLPEMKNEFNQLFSNNNMTIITNEIEKYEKQSMECKGGKGVFVNDKLTFLLFINQYSHLKFMSIGQNDKAIAINLGAVYQQLIEIYEHFMLEAGEILFVRHERFGWVTMSPSNLGTTLQIIIQITLKKLMENDEKLKEITNKYNFAIKMITECSSSTTADDECDASNGNLYELKNIQCMGKTEFEIIKEFHEGIMEIISLENE